MTDTRAIRSARGRANLAKSKRMEQTLVSYLRTHGWPGAERTARPGYRVAGRSRADLGDVDGTVGVVWQAKATAEHRLWSVPEWLAETAAQRDAARADYGLLVIKRPGHAVAGRWWAYLELGELLRLATEPHGAAGNLHPSVLASPDPVRLELDALLPLLHAAGYGTPPAPLAGPQSAERGEVAS